MHASVVLGLPVASSDQYFQTLHIGNICDEIERSIMINAAIAGLQHTY